MPTPDALQDLATSLEPYLADLDTDAIHDNVANEITAITLKAAPTIADVLLAEDAAAAAVKKSVTIGAVLKAAGQVSNLTAAVPLVTDTFAFEDQSDTDAMKQATIQEILSAAGWVTGLAAKAQPTVSDKIAIEDAADAAAMKESTIQSLFSALGWITGLASKATPTTSDKIVIEDAADVATPKEATILSLPVYHTTVAGEIAATAAKAVPVAADVLLINDSAAANALASVTIGTLPITQSQVASVVAQPAADAAFEIDGTIGGVQLTVTGAGNVAISTNANCYAGQKVNLFALAVAGGGSYTLALDVGTLTLNATSESAVVQRNAGDTAWVCVGLSGATIV